MKELSMMVVSCDAYTDLGYIFFELQDKFMGWFTENRYFVNENKRFEYKNVKNINVGDEGEWSDKVRKALSYIDTRYVLFMLEDYFIGKKVIESEIEQALDIMKKHNLKYYKITPVPKINGNSIIADYLADIPANKRYGINLQAAIFEKNFLLKIVKNRGLNAWQVENELNKGVKEDSKESIPGCVLDKRIIIDIHNGVIKGKWVPKTIEYFNNLGYRINLGDRPIMNKKDLRRRIIIGSFSHVFSAKATRRIKGVLKKLGIKFVTD